MEPMPGYIDVTVILGVGGLLWRQMASMDRRLTDWTGGFGKRRA